MASTPESKTKARIKACLTAHGCYFYMPVPGGYGAPSLDFISARPSDGHVFAIEAKAGGEHPTDRQKAISRQMEVGGWKVFVIDDDGMPKRKHNYATCADLKDWLTGWSSESVA